MKNPVRNKTVQLLMDSAAQPINYKARDNELLLTKLLWKNYSSRFI